MAMAATPIDTVGPDLNFRRPKIKLPACATDAHIHLFGPAEHYRFDPRAAYHTEDALPETYLALQDALGLDRAVIVSGGAYGCDPTHLLDMLRRFPGRFKGVMVPPAQLSDAQLQEMDDLGVRALRFFNETAWDYLPRLDAKLAARAYELGWHIQFFAFGERPDLSQDLHRLLELPNDIVIDHFGSVDAGQGIEQPAFQAVLTLLESGRGWVKMSRPMMCSSQELPYPDLLPFAHKLVDVAPDRLLWGSDWPHVVMNDVSMPNDADLLDLMLDWVPDERTRNRILVDNPAKLYRWPVADDVA
jgi:predicted TIM-barrel fold metal-dependent hydrolase